MKLNDDFDPESRFNFCAYRDYDTFTAILTSKNAQILETKHPYDNDEDFVWPIDLTTLFALKTPEVFKVAIAFDPASSTELNRDYVSFWNADPKNSKTDDLSQFGSNISGSSASAGMPSAVNPMFIKSRSNTLYAHWISDGSVVGEN